MKIVFAGTPAFARVALEQLHAAGFEIALVLTQPDRPAGRGMKLLASPVKQFALAHGIPVAQPRSLRLDGKFPDDAAAAQAALQAAQADAMVVAAYGLILPQWVLDLLRGTPAATSLAAQRRTDAAPPGLGCLNIHASLLPRWRGAAPIHRAIEAGDTETGVTLMQMDAGLDTGDMLRMEKMAIEPDDTTGRLHDRLAEVGGRMIVQLLRDAARGPLLATPQPAQGVSYAHKIDKAEAAIDWTQPVAVIERRIRAFDPFPGASSVLAGESIKLWKSEINSKLTPIDGGYGHILFANSTGVGVQCGDGVLRLTELQRAGGKRLAAADFLRGFALQPGLRFGLA
ncbi:MAG: methionyl-tRNA formyltransferase [Burkholderiaceae bacterium]|nr:methionyl-tRNA formyltransferase [Burkholderiaceae bacterium]MDZ4145848.1 methionyl-tRNA formyltransferase [Burkholderiales bacterium]